MYSISNTPSTGKRRVVIGGLAAVVLLGGVFIKAADIAGAHTESQQTVLSTSGTSAGRATLQLMNVDGNVLVSIKGMPANASLTVGGTVGQASGRGTFRTTANGSLMVALAPGSGATRQLKVTATSGTTTVTKSISLAAGQGQTGTDSAEEHTEDEASDHSSTKSSGGQTRTAPAKSHIDENSDHETDGKDTAIEQTDDEDSSGGLSCDAFAGKDSSDTCQGPMDGEAGELQRAVAAIMAELKDEAGMKAAGLKLDGGSTNHYRVYDTKYGVKVGGAHIAMLIEQGGKIRGAQIDTSGKNPEWMNQVPSSGGDSSMTHMDGKGGYWHDPH